MKHPSNRTIFHLATIASSIFGLLIAAMWVRSYFYSDAFEWQRNYRQRFVAIVGGRVLLQVNHGPSGENETEPLTHNPYRFTSRDSRDMGRPWRYGGFWMEDLTFIDPPTATRADIPYTDYVVPLYPLLLATSVLPVMWWRRKRRERASRIELRGEESEGPIVMPLRAVGAMD